MDGAVMLMDCCVRAGLGERLGLLLVRAAAFLMFTVGCA